MSLCTCHTAPCSTRRLLPSRKRRSVRRKSGSAGIRSKKQQSIDAYLIRSSSQTHAKVGIFDENLIHGLRKYPVSSGFSELPHNHGLH
ncbi:unnamed protein product [Echinostoma caproni]|uniref:Uncharacterized protein n=1 Tax=Echinostoma caproni TaxID=27848 RepID=A0A183B4L1_9TREM|nr:unnamed protein product [Echinostoma caproni]